MCVAFVQVNQHLRDSVSFRDHALEVEVDAALLAGAIDCRAGGWRSIACKGNPGEIERAKKNGDYDAAFCTSPGTTLAYKIPNHQTKNFVACAYSLLFVQLIHPPFFVNRGNCSPMAIRVSVRSKKI